MCVRVFVCASLRVCVCVCVCARARVFVCACVCVCEFACVCVLLLWVCGWVGGCGCEGVRVWVCVGVGVGGVGGVGVFGCVWVRASLIPRTFLPANTHLPAFSCSLLPRPPLKPSLSLFIRPNTQRSNSMSYKASASVAQGLRGGYMCKAQSQCLHKLRRGTEADDEQVQAHVPRIRRAR